MEKQEMTTPLNRFFAFWWILAAFAVFGLLALVAYLLGGKKEDKAYEAESKKRLEIREKVDEAQSAELAKVKLDFASGAKLLSGTKPVASKEPAPGTPTYVIKMKKIQEEMDRQAQEKLLKEAEESGAQVLTVTSTVATLQFVEKTLTAKAGEDILILIKNPDTATKIPEGEEKAPIGHNFVLCMPGTLQAVATAAMTAIETEYIPKTDDIIAYSKLLYFGQSEVVKVKALEPGEYPYVCTFPGHFINMKGVLTVTPAE